MGQKDLVGSPRSTEGLSRAVSPRVRSPRKGARQQAYSLLLPLIGLVGMTVILSGSNLLNQTRESFDRLSDPNLAIRLVRMPARHMLNKPMGRDRRNDSEGGGSGMVTSGSLFVDRGEVQSAYHGDGQTLCEEAQGTGGGCRHGQYDASLIQDGDTRVRLQELGVGREGEGASNHSQPWERFTQLTEEEKKAPFDNAGLLMDGDAYVYAQRLQSESQQQSGEQTGGAGTNQTSWNETSAPSSINQARWDGIKAESSVPQTEPSSSDCPFQGAVSSDTANSSSLENPLPGLVVDCIMQITHFESQPVGSNYTNEPISSPLLEKRISRLSRWYRWNDTAPPEADAGLAGRALSGSVNESLWAAEGGAREEDLEALPLWSLGISELERGGENGTWLELGAPGNDTWIRVYRAWLTRDRFLGLFSLLFLALSSNSPSASLHPPNLQCQVGPNTAHVTSSTSGGSDSALLLLHCPLAPTFSDQLTQARPDSKTDAQWRPGTVLLEPTTVLPVTLTLLDSPQDRDSSDAGNRPTETVEKSVAQLSFTLKPLASLVRQPRYTLAACIGPINTTFTRGEWVEFVEYHTSIVGVEHFYVYMGANQTELLQDYEQEKTVTIVPWETSAVPGRSDRGNGSSEQDWRSLARNQCLWHTRGLAHWTLFLDSPAASVQIDSHYGHSFKNWSAGLGDDRASVELKKLRYVEPLHSLDLPANASLNLQRCSLPVPGPAQGAGERAFLAAGSKVRYVGRSPELDQVTPGEAPQHGIELSNEIAVQECDRRPGTVDEGTDVGDSGIMERMFGSRKGQLATRERKQQSGGVRERSGPDQLSHGLLRQLELRIQRRMQQKGPESSATLPGTEEQETGVHNLAESGKLTDG